MLAGQVALTIAAMFTGAAVYVNVAEQLARLQLDDRSLLTEWKPAYKRGYIMQASLAIVGAVFGSLPISALSTGVSCSEPSSCSQIGLTRSLSSCQPTGVSWTRRRRPPRLKCAACSSGGGALHPGRSALGVVATLSFLWAQR